MPTTETLLQNLIVDNTPRDHPRKRWTRWQNRIGGIRGGATRRFLARHVHYMIVHLAHLGVPKATIAKLVGRCLSTVYAVLSGRIRRCLTAAETVLLGPWRPGKFAPLADDSTEVSPRNIEVVRHSPKRRQPRRNFCQPDCGRDHKHWFTPYEWARRRGKQQAYFDKATEPQPDGVLCYCGFVKHRLPQPCPMCGRGLHEQNE